jgi:hypothetical protein
LTVQRNISPPSSGLESKLSKKPTEAGTKQHCLKPDSANVPPNLRSLSELHGFTTQKTVYFMLFLVSGMYASCSANHTSRRIQILNLLLVSVPRLPPS